MPEAPPDTDTFRPLVQALKRYRARLARKLEAMRADLAEAKRGPEYRRFGEALLAYLRQVPARAARVSLPDPADRERTLEIPLDPALRAQENAARYFKRAAKAERGLAEIPPRIASAGKELDRLTAVLERAHQALPAEAEPLATRDPNLMREVLAAFEALPPALRRSLGGPRIAPSPTATGRAAKPAPAGRLEPRRITSAEGWEVLIGRSNEGNDYLTHKLARPEDYWFHVHGAAGSHVVLRRGKGKDEPSKSTLEEVASWAAFQSQARTAGKVPVIYTRKKYVRKPRGGKPGLALCEREKTIMVRPQEPPKVSRQDPP